MGGVTVCIRETGLQCNPQNPNSASSHNRYLTGSTPILQHPHFSYFQPSFSQLIFLPFSSNFHIATIMPSTLELLSKHRAAVGVAAVASTAFALFGYDTTIAGGVIALKRHILRSWQISLTNIFAVSRSSSSSQQFRSNLRTYHRTSSPY